MWIFLCFSVTNVSDVPVRSQDQIKTLLDTPENIYNMHNTEIQFHKEVGEWLFIVRTQHENRFFFILGFFGDWNNSME